MGLTKVNYRLVSLVGQRPASLNSIIADRFPEVFTENQGGFWAMVHPSIDSTVTPKVLAECLVPVIIKAQLQQVLQDLEEKHIIAEVDQPAV